MVKKTEYFLQSDRTSVIGELTELTELAEFTELAELAELAEFAELGEDIRISSRVSGELIVAVVKREARSPRIEDAHETASRQRRMNQLSLTRQKRVCETIPWTEVHGYDQFVTT